MLAFLKRWRQAYLEDKGNRLHAETICGTSSDNQDFLQAELRKWRGSVSEAMNESHRREDWNGRERY
ncbi:hypothetical protein ACNO5M_03310 [Vibrio owensii]|uniref:hypothetical protein n=1 Tax=Vibrio owensii TaxID=696485 RepID=UPI003AAAE2E3